MCLVAVEDVKTACLDKLYKILWQSVKMWNKANKSDAAYEIAHIAVRFFQVVPNATRWSFYSILLH